MTDGKNFKKPNNDRWLWSTGKDFDRFCNESNEFDTPNEFPFELIAILFQLVDRLALSKPTKMS